MAATFPAGNNTFVPSHDASGAMVVEFSRNPKSFAINRWAQIVPVKQSVGYWLDMTVEMAGRILNSGLQDFMWADGQGAPEGNDGQEGFQFSGFNTKRYAFPYVIGWKASQQSAWDILAQHGRIHAQRAMTARTQAAVTLATTSGNYAATHTSTTTALAGGKWGVATTANPYIKMSLNAAAERILLDTLGAVRPDDLMLVVNPTAARKMAESQEIIDHIKGSPHAQAQIQGEAPWRNARFGLPDNLYGWEVQIEDAVKVTSRKGATKATSFVLDTNTPFMCARPGGLVGVEGSPSFSTVSIFAYEEMTVERKDDPDNRRTKGRVVDDYDVKLTAPVSGYLFTAAVT